MLVQLINLDSRPDRLAAFSEEAAAIGLAFDRLPACNGSLPEFEDRAAQIPVTPRGEPVGPRALACTESHRVGWRRLIDEGHDYGVMLEDDIYMAPDLGDICSRTDWIPADADLVKLETMNYRVLLSKETAGSVSGRSIHRMLSDHLGTGGYVVSRAAAEKLLAATDVSDDTIDRMMFDTISPLSRSLTIYQMTPAPCAQVIFLDEAAPEWGKSDINTERYEGAVDANGFPVRQTLSDKLSYTVRGALRAARGKIAELRLGGSYKHIPFEKIPGP